MPAKNTRILVTPTAVSYGLISEIARLSGKPVAGVVRGLLQELEPALTLLVEAHRGLSEHPEKAREIVLDMAAKGNQQIDQAVLDLDAAMRRKPGRKPKAKDGQGAAKT